MKRRVTGLVAAGVLALVGTLMLVGYVRNAEARALEGEELTTVMVVNETIPAGTPGSSIADLVDAEEIPAKVRADGAIGSLDDVKGLVTTVDLVPGEQLVIERFAAQAERAGVPDGLMEVTVRLEPERAVGGNIRPGDRVAVVSSFDPFEIDAAGQPGSENEPKKTPNTSHLVLHKVLVTNVQLSSTAPTQEADEDQVAMAPAGTLLVTLAVDAEAVQRIVFTAEHGFLWLSAEPAGAPEPELIVETLGSVYR